MKYLADQIGEEYQNWKNQDIVLITAPTGIGKTTFILKILLPYIMKQGGRMLYLVNRKVLKEQLQKELADIKNEYLLQGNGMSSIDRYITIDTYQQYEKMILRSGAVFAVNSLQKYSVLVCDESHYFFADSSFNTYTELSYDLLRVAFVNKLQIYMSATMQNMEQFITKRYFFISPADQYRNDDKVLIKSINVERDYSYIQLKYFNTKEEMKKIVTDSSNAEKWLIFTDSIEAGKALCNEIKERIANQTDVGYIDAKYALDEDSQEIIDEITKDNFTQKRILIATAVIDNGISIKDEDLRNIVIMADTEESFVQMLGRKRPDGQNLNVYICKRDKRYFERRLRYVQQVLKFYDEQAVCLNQMFQDFSHKDYVFPFIKVFAAYGGGQTLREDCCAPENYVKNGGIGLQNNQQVYFPFYIQQTILESIITGNRMSDYAKKLLYPIGGLYAVNSFSLKRFRTLMVFYQEMLQKISEDEDAFVKQQASWLGINEEKVSMAIQESKEELDEMHRNQIIEILTSQGYVGKELSKEENMKQLKPDLKEDLLYFAKIKQNYDGEDDAKIRKAVNALNKNDRTISEKDFNLFMKISDLPYNMKKKGADVFKIEIIEK